jgi:hypothetical protein
VSNFRAYLELRELVDACFAAAADELRAGELERSHVMFELAGELAAEAVVLMWRAMRHRSTDDPSSADG